MYAYNFEAEANYSLESLTFVVRSLFLKDHPQLLGSRLVLYPVGGDFAAPSFKKHGR